MKTKEKICVALTPKLACSDILKIITTTKLEEFDIAKASHQWQYALQTVEEHLRKYDLQAIFLIPDSFVICDADSVRNARNYTNILTNWCSVSVDDCKRWQRWLLRWSGNADRESGAWVQDILRRTMDDELRIDISSDMLDLEQEERGVVTMFRLIVERIVMRN